LFILFVKTNNLLSLLEIRDVCLFLSMKTIFLKRINTNRRDVIETMEEFNGHN